MVRVLRAAVAVALAQWHLATAAPPPNPRPKSGRSPAPPPPPPVGWALSHHSFEKTLTYDDHLDDWLHSAGTMALRDRVQLIPPVPDRHGLMWNMKPVTTSDFEVTFTMTLDSRTAKDGGDNQFGNEDGHFAFWLSPDDFVSAYNEQSILSQRNWTQGLENNGYVFVDNKADFRGLGVVFLSQGTKGMPKEPRPSVTAVWNNGKQGTRQLYSDVPAVKGSEKSGEVQTEFVEWRKDQVQMKVKYSTSGVVVSAMVPPSSAFKELFRFPAFHIPGDWAKYYVGFSGWSGTTTYQEVSLNRFEVRNFDDKHKGEDMEDVFGQGGEDPWVAVLESEKKMIDQKSQKEAVERLTKLLQEHVERYNKLGERVKTDLLSLEDRLQGLETNFKTEISALSSWDSDTGEFDVSHVREHLTGIRSIIAKDKEVHDNKLESLSKVSEEIKSKSQDTLSADNRIKVQSVAETAKALEEQVSAGSFQTNALLIGMVLVVLGLGVMFMRRMSYYEKKHYI